MGTPSGWSSAYSVGVSALDQEHRRLFRIMEQLDEALSHAQGQSVIKSVLDQLIEYTIQHFKSEETILEQHAYADVAFHRAQHSELSRRLVQFQKDYASGEYGVAARLLELLRTWLREHVMKTDKKYGTFLNQKGIR